MDKEKNHIFFILIFSGIVLAMILIMQPLEILYAKNIPILDPKGTIALEQRNALFIIQAIMLLVVIPVYVLTFVFSWRYYAPKPTGKYDPSLEGSWIAESIWWIIPLILVIFIATLTWYDTHRLDPYKPIPSENKPIKIQVVALQWKWLFLYPEENIASLNFFQFPEKTPLQFEITADAPMNSFWIPQLGGQIYAMPNMVTVLHLIANEIGEFMGSSANISGVGFSGMHFIAKASSEEDYQAWKDSIKESGNSLDYEAYQQLALPSQNNPVALYQLADQNLFHQILKKYMPPNHM